jgi:hypothetical protein
VPLDMLFFAGLSGIAAKVNNRCSRRSGPGLDGGHVGSNCLSTRDLLSVIDCIVDSYSPTRCCTKLCSSWIAPILMSGMATGFEILPDIVSAVQGAGG